MSAVYPNQRYRRPVMSDVRYATLPRNFHFQPMQVAAPISPGRSIASLNGETNLVNGMQRFGSLPANLQTFPMQRVMSVPGFAQQYPYTPSRPVSQFAYHMPTHPIVPVSRPIAWNRRPNSYYPTPSLNGSDNLYTNSQHIPRSYTNHASYMLRSRLNGAYNGNSTSSNENKVTKIQLANKLELEEITLRRKSENDFIGLIIEILPEALDQDVVIVVQRIISGGMCHKDGKIQRGDRILKVNGHRVKDLDSTVEILRQANITLTVARATALFKRDNIRIVRCNPFGYKPIPKGTKKLTAFTQGIPRMVKGVNESKLEVEMISLCRRLEKVRTGSKKARWHLYNVDKEEFVSINNDSKSMKNHQKKATKQQATKKLTPHKSTMNSEMNILEKPLSKQPNKPKVNKSKNVHKPNTQMPTYRPIVPVVQPYPYWVPTVTQPTVMRTMNHAPMTYQSFQNGGVYPQQMNGVVRRSRSASVPSYSRQHSENGSPKIIPNKRRSTGYEETLL